MTIRRSTEALVAVALIVAAAWAVLIVPDLTRHAAETAIALWWNHLVPIMLPGYVLSQALLTLIPVRSGWILTVMALCTFPPLVALVIYDQARTEGQPAQPHRSWLPLLLYTNLYNPLLFPHPEAVLLLDGALFLAALLIIPPWKVHPEPIPRAPAHPRQWIVDGMNWTTILGMVVVLTYIIHQWWPPLPLAWLLDPIPGHWARPVAPGVLTIFETAVGGLAYWIPIVIRMSPSRAIAMKFLAVRTLQASLATFIWLIASQRLG